MKRKFSKYINIYVVIAFIGIFSFGYLFSFIFVINDVSSGSSLKMKKEFCSQNPEKC